ncbi:Uncharacterised protein [Burkholderia pseudomallei]|nr:Uncharacterised protein [Burkholderia pseudomallei]
MRDDHARHLQRADRRVHLPFALQIEVARRFVEHENLRPFVKRAREQHALLLSARQHRAHVADERVVAHRHRDDVRVHGRELRAFGNPLRVGVRIEEADVVGDRAREQHVVLQHGAHQRAQPIEPEALDVDAADPDLAARRLEDAEQHVDECRLAAARRADQRDGFARLDLQRYTVEHGRLAFGVAEHEVLGLDARAEVLRLAGHVAHARVGFALGEHDVGEPFALQLQHLHLEELVDQAADAAVELPLVCIERHQHADREFAVHHEPRAQPDDDEPFEAEQQPVQLLIQQLQLLHVKARVDLLDEQREPARAALGLPVEQLDRLHAAHRFEEVALLFRGVDDLILRRAPQRPVPEPAQERVQRHRAERDERERAAVDEHHRERDDRHQPVDHRGQERCRHRLLDRVDRAEARHDVAEMAALEILNRQIQHVREHVRTPLHVERRTEIHQRPRANRARRLLHQQQQAEAEREHGQQVAVGADDHLVDHPLQKERRHEREHFERDREHEDLAERARQPGHGAEQLAQLHGGRCFARLEAARRPQLERNAGERARHFLERQLAHALRRIVNDRVLAADFLQHDEVVEVPVQHAGHAQLAELLEIELQRARAEIEALRDVDHAAQTRALERHGKARAHRREVDVVTVKACNHREARKAAFGGFGLQDHRQLAADAEREAIEE